MTKYDLERFLGTGEGLHTGFETDFLHSAAALGIGPRSAWIMPLRTLFTLQEFALNSYGYQILASVMADHVKFMSHQPVARKLIKPAFYIGGKAAIGLDHFENGYPWHRFYYRPIDKFKVWNAFAPSEEEQ